MLEEVRKQLEQCNKIDDFINLSKIEVENILDKDSSDMLSSNNKFLGRDAKHKFLVFNLPQGISCPEATDICKTSCYQIVCEERLTAKGCNSAVLAYRKMNLLKSLQDNFVEEMYNKIDSIRPKTNQKIYIRIHASGDFYSEVYLRKWMEIALRIKKTGKNYTFVAYTKSMNILKNVMDSKNKSELDSIYKRVYNNILNEYKIKDFNIQLIGSVMDDTKLYTTEIMNVFRLPKYIVTSDTRLITDYCGNKLCVDCLKCYTFPMCNDIYSVLRE